MQILKLFFFLFELFFGTISFFIGFFFLMESLKAKFAFTIIADGLKLVSTLHVFRKRPFNSLSLEKDKKNEYQTSLFQAAASAVYFRAQFNLIKTIFFLECDNKTTERK
jgi:hypothetical protein